jgi:hypothetical protein
MLETFMMQREAKCDRQWEVMFRELQANKEEHGNCYVPKRYQANPSLGHWVSNECHALRQKCWDGDHRSMKPSGT